MPFCKNCGQEVKKKVKFCPECGESTETNEEAPSNNAPTQVIEKPPEKAPRKYGIAVWLIPLILILLFTCCCCASLYSLSVIGAKGQPATIIPPSTSGGTSEATGEPTTSGNSVDIPTNLQATASSNDIKLNWSKVPTTNLKEYRVYKSVTPGDNFVMASTIEAGQTNYVDSKVQEGVTYYYVVTAATTKEAESGNSNQASAIIDSPPLVPKGTYSWEDVKNRCEADPKYLTLLTDVTGLTKADVDRLTNKEKGGMNLKTTLKKGTIITNSTKDYKILPGYTLKRDRVALTDEGGTPHVLIKCGNPMILHVPVTIPAVIIQQTQVVIINVINIFPPTIINIFVNISQPVNDVVISVLPEGIRISMGPTFVPPPPDIFIDPIDVGLTDDIQTDDETVTPEHEDDTTTDTTLEEGHQWIEEGKLKIEANPPDPAPSQSVKMTIRLLPAQQGVDIKYSVSGTDGYKKSGTEKTNAEGIITFNIPGGGQSVKDTITVEVPSLGLSGTVSYTF